MVLICRIAGHQTAAETIMNGGYAFSRCRRCRHDLVQLDGRWSAAPRGFRIVWKSKVDEPSAASENHPCSQPAREAPPEDLPCAAPVAPPELRLLPPPVERRAKVDRRVSNGGPLPKFLNGQDRRRFPDRRKSFGSKAGPLVSAAAPAEAIALPRWVVTSEELEANNQGN